MAARVFVLVVLLWAPCAVTFTRADEPNLNEPRPGDVTLPSYAPSGVATQPAGQVPGQFPQPPDRPALTTLPPPPSVEREPVVTGEQFPTDPPSPPPSNTPPPLAPSGRWLHKMVLIDNDLYVYGGVGQYSNALYNDVWMYNWVEQTWTELQASYVPPLPNTGVGKNQPQKPQGALDMFRPEDNPPPPATRDLPFNGPVTAPVQGQRFGENGSPNPVLQPAKGKPLPVVNYKTLPYRDDKPAGYSFLQTKQRVRRKTQTGASWRVLPHPLRMLRQRQVSTAPAPGRPPSFLQVDLTQTPPTSVAPKLPTKVTENSPFLAADLWKFNIETRKWTNIESPSRAVPVPRWLHSMVVVNGRILVFGGVSFSDVVLGDLWVMNPADRTWMKANPAGQPILPREGHTAVVLSNKFMVVFGGISYGQVPFNDAWIYDASANKWNLQDIPGTAPPPRWLHTADVHTSSDNKQKMYVFGGVTRNYVPLNDLWIFELQGGKPKWIHPPVNNAPPFPRMLHTSSIVYNTLLVHSGQANNIPLEDLWLFDMETLKWEEQNEFGVYPLAREGAAMAEVVPPAAEFEEMKREPWVPPKPPADPNTPEALMPTIKNYTTARPLNRFRHQYNPNRWVVLFGGAGPKPRQ